MPKIKLDHTFCLTAQCEPGRRKTDYWDVIVSGFVLEARSSGGKTYYLRYFDAAGRQRQHKIGGHGEITFDQAKKAAQRLRSEVVLGGSPAEAEAEKKAIPTYAELAEQHIAHAKTYQKRPENTEAVIRGHLIPRFGKLLLTEISQQEVAKWLAEKRDSGLAPATVEKLRVTLGKSFALAATWNLPGGQANPVRGIAANASSRQACAPFFDLRAAILTVVASKSVRSGMGMANSWPFAILNQLAPSLATPTESHSPSSGISAGPNIGHGCRGCQSESR